MYYSLIFGLLRISIALSVFGFVANKYKRITIRSLSTIRNIRSGIRWAKPKVILNYSMLTTSNNKIHWKELPVMITLAYWSKLIILLKSTFLTFHIFAFITFTHSFKYVIHNCGAYLSGNVTSVTSINFNEYHMAALCIKRFTLMPGPGNPCWNGRISTIDFLVLTLWDQLLFILTLYFSFLQSNLNEEVNCTEPSPLVRFHCLSITLSQKIFYLWS